MEQVNCGNARQRSSSGVAGGLLCEEGKRDGQQGEKSEGSFERSWRSSFERLLRSEASPFFHWISPFESSEGSRCLGCRFRLQSATRHVKKRGGGEHEKLQGLPDAAAHHSGLLKFSVNEENMMLKLMLILSASLWLASTECWR